jgi:ADP-ribosylglycohydrolase
MKTIKEMTDHVTPGALPGPLPADYAERVYAGVLGKVLGVYLGRPFEGWLYSRIQEELGDIEYYVHDKVGVPLIVVDDDITGTLAFLSAIGDNGYDFGVTPEQIGDAWLNYVIQDRTIFWWGGMGNSTEHTAYLRLKEGVPAPRSGSKELNGQVVAEQIGSQIFIDAWAMLVPGQPELAADIARRAAVVSHDGEAVFAAQVMAAMEAQAFVEQDIDRIIDAGLSVIPSASVIAQLIRDLREWHRTEPDWRVARERLEADYGYETYGGNVHVVPNHGLIILALLYGAGDWDRSMMIVNTCGWDTDCNSGNLGALLGIRNGLAGFAGSRDWRGPVADTVYLPIADGARTVSDAATEALVITNIARRIRGEQPLVIKDGAQFSFPFPGAVQGFRVISGSGAVEVAEDAGADGSLGLRLSGADGSTALLMTPTFMTPDTLTVPGYGWQGTPRVNPGQTLRAMVRADAASARVCLAVQVYDEADQLRTVTGPEVQLSAGTWTELSWILPEMGGYPIATIGLQVDGTDALDVDRMDWRGAPCVLLNRPSASTTAWRRAWINGMDLFSEGWGPGWPESYRLIQNQGSGLISYGPRDWTDVDVTAPMTPHMALSIGVAVRVQGMRRRYALLLTSEGRVRLVKTVDGRVTVLAEESVPWNLYTEYTVRVRAHGDRITGWVDGKQVVDVVDTDGPLTCGGIGLICEEGRVGVGSVAVRPAS